MSPKLIIISEWNLKIKKLKQAKNITRTNYVKKEAVVKETINK